jgi:hypothetical protein
VDDLVRDGDRVLEAPALVQLFRSIDPIREIDDVLGVEGRRARRGRKAREIAERAGNALLSSVPRDSHGLHALQGRP